MREIIAQYAKLARILPEAEPEVEPEARPQEKPEEKAFFAPYRKTTAGGANPDLARLASPLYSHERLCQIVKTLFVYARQSGDIRDFYRKIRDQLDPGQCLNYRDFAFSRKIAVDCLKFLYRTVFKRFCAGELLGLASAARASLGVKA